MMSSFNNVKRFAGTLPLRVHHKTSRVGGGSDKTNRARRSVIPAPPVTRRAVEKQVRPSTMLARVDAMNKALDQKT